MTKGFLVFIGFLFVGLNANACDCERLPDLTEADIIAANVIFEGELRNLKRDGKTRNWEFIVTKPFKGTTIGQSIKLTSELNWLCYKQSVKVGQLCYIFSSTIHSKTGLNQLINCGRSARISKSNQTYKTKGTSKRPYRRYNRNNARRLKRDIRFLTKYFE